MPISLRKHCGHAKDSEHIIKYICHVFGRKFLRLTYSWLNRLNTFFMVSALGIRVGKACLSPWIFPPGRFWVSFLFWNNLTLYFGSRYEAGGVSVHYVPQRLTNHILLNDYSSTYIFRSLSRLSILFSSSVSLVIWADQETFCWSWWY